ncbi:hypothetical protein GCM10012278_03290 [Nonomuraea glycinis]|uniref:Uncharacterized protein n=1 Tax=Nonomuraea glycinis TaxID=2047744 RepID=A0A918E1J9_9ACTN|nr:hypothetical protein GCM10012278_03290 [Nonomuraea glycinis]
MAFSTAAPFPVGAAASPPVASEPHAASAEVARTAAAASTVVRILVLFTGSFLTRFVLADDLIASLIDVARPPDCDRGTSPSR